MSLRLAVARHSGLAETELDGVGRRGPAGLDERRETALALVDRFLSRPADIDGDLAERVRRHFSPAEIVELLCDAAKWSTQKTLVALRIDDALGDGDGDGDDGPAFFDFDDDGEVAWVSRRLR